MRAPQDFIAIQPIPGPTGVRAYNPGDDVPASAVENLGLKIGEQVRAARADAIARPAGNAKRAEWEAYWHAQGLPQDEIESMTRDELAAKEPLRPDEAPIEFRPVALPGEAVAGVQTFRNPTPDVVAQQATEQTNGVTPDVTPDDAPERPAANASKAEWVEYAVARGMPREAAEESTKAALQEHNFDGAEG